MENASPRLLIPQLKPFYDRVEPLSWALIRLTVGLMIIPHGWPYSLDRKVGREL